ncbi:MAG: segregation/condensation protein A [Nanoarchaeota archaeon]|nr:segregation/condensation protein A [Nanoarchaeota archaeon]
MDPIETVAINQPISGPYHEHILSILSNKDEITWQSVLYELVKTEQMDPWDIDVSLLSHKYIETLKKLKEFDMALSGKVVLASAILLKIKSKKLLTDDLEAFDNMLSGQDEESLLEGESLEEVSKVRIKIDGISLIPRTPQPRKRKVSIFELVDALRLALETDRRRLVRIRPIEMVLPERKFDISAAMKLVYKNIIDFFTGDAGGKLTFTQLVPTDEKMAKIQTFIPLLHLTNQRKIDLIQEMPFGEVEVRLNADKQVDKELSSELDEIEAVPDE